MKFVWESFTHVDRVGVRLVNRNFRVWKTVLEVELRDHDLFREEAMIYKVRGSKLWTVDVETCPLRSNCYGRLSDAKFGAERRLLVSLSEAVEENLLLLRRDLSDMRKEERKLKDLLQSIL